MALHKFTINSELLYNKMLYCYLTVLKYYYEINRINLLQHDSMIFGWGWGSAPFEKLSPCLGQSHARPPRNDNNSRQQHSFDIKSQLHTRSVLHNFCFNCLNYPNSHNTLWLMHCKVNGISFRRRTARVLILKTS